MKSRFLKFIPLFDSLSYFNSSIPPLCIEQNAELPVESTTDYTQAFQFLYTYRGSNETFNAYRREIERFLQWSWYIAKKNLATLRRTDIENFIEFCQSPPKEWIGIKNVPRFYNKAGKRLPHPEWRPFVASVSKKAHTQGKQPSIQAYVFSQSSVQAIFSVLSSFFNYLVQEEYATANPIGQIRQKSKFLRKKPSLQPIRRLSELQWSYLLEITEKMASENPECHERSLFIMTALYAMYLRISELSVSARWEPQMGHFFRDIDGNWWFKTVGKGNKERNISVSDAMLAALKRYRLSLQLTALPAPAETTPLLPKTSGRGGISGTRYLRKIVQVCFDKTIQCLIADGFNEEAEALASATVHWLRHTGISEDVKYRPREHVRDDAGHSSSAVTDRYIDVELRARHASAKKKPLKNL